MLIAALLSVAIVTGDSPQPFAQSIAPDTINVYVQVDSVQTDPFLASELTSYFRRELRSLLDIQVQDSRSESTNFAIHFKGMRISSNSEPIGWAATIGLFRPCMQDEDFTTLFGAVLVDESLEDTERQRLSMAVTDLRYICFREVDRALITTRGDREWTSAIRRLIAVWDTNFFEPERGR